MKTLSLVIVGLLLAVAVVAVTHVRPTNKVSEIAEPVAAVSRAVTQAVAPARATHAPATAPRTSLTEWRQHLTDGTDPLQFVKAALPAAKAGDGRAAYEIAEVLKSCAYQMYVADPEAQLQQDLTRIHPKFREDFERNARICFGLAKENPFGNLPETPEYWMARAYAAGDPSAQEDKAAQAAADITVDPQMPAAVRAAKVQVVEDNLRTAIESGDPAVLFQAGILMANPLLSTDTLRGFAVALAACDLGYNCMPGTPDNLAYECTKNGQCPPGAQDFRTTLQTGMGPENYAQVYALAQQVVLAARAQDWNAVLANLTIDQPQTAQASLQKRMAEIQEKEQGLPPGTLQPHP